VIAAVVFIVSALGALTSLAFAWEKFSEGAHQAEHPQWRRKAAGIACLVIAAQGINLLAFFFSPVSREAHRDWVRYILWLFILGLPFVLVAKGPTRWYLLLSSALLSVVGFFVVLGVLAF